MGVAGNAGLGDAASLNRSALLLAAALVPYLPLVGAPLLVDERVLAFEVRKWISLDPLSPWHLPLGGSFTWRPLTAYTYWLDAGAGPWVQHATNLMLHALTVGLAHGWLRRHLAPGPALAAALMWAVHASHVATAGWVAGRADLLMTLFALLALRAQADGRSWACGLFAAAAILCKETGAALPLLLVVVAAVTAPPRGWRSAGLASVAVAAAMAWTLKVATVHPDYLPTPAHVGRALPALPLYALELAVPWFQPAGLFELSRDIIGASLALVILGGMFAAGRNSVGFALGWALAALALLPVVHVLPNDGGQWYLLLPSLGVALAWGAVAQARPGRWVQVFIGFCAAVTLAESMAWRAAALEIDRVISAAAELPAEEREPPQRQRPADWPHRGPSFCCGLPYQLFEPPP